MVFDEKESSSMTAKVTIRRSKAWTFTCPICDWPGVGQTEAVAGFTARYHLREVHPGVEAKVEVEDG